MRIAPFAVFLLCAVSLCSWAGETLELDRNDDGETDQWYDLENGVVAQIHTDRNNDGEIDHSVRYGTKGNKIYEEYDFNYDGPMDDFYFYENGVLQRQEIDTNFDEQVDVWVFLHKGIYIRRYEIDTDYDGKVDRVVDYDQA